MTLKEATIAAGIAHAHIVDDAFDVAPGAGLHDAAIHTFLAAIDGEQFDAAAVVLGIPGADEDKIVERLRTQGGAAALYAQKAPYGKAADQLFQDFANAVGPEKNLLTPLISALESLGIIVHKFGRDYELNGEPEPQILFVDLKLNEDKIRIEDPIGVVRKMRDRYPDAHPLVFLMSTQKSSLAADRDTFRDRAKLFSSQFEDIPKEKFERAQVLERFLEHHIRVYLRIVALQHHIESWGRAMAVAKDKLEATLRQLDLADYFVLGNTASADGVKLGGYVTDILLEYLAHQIEGAGEVGEFAKEMDSWNLKTLTRSRFSIAPIVADIFAANVLHSSDRLEWEKECGLGPSNGTLSMGDVFFLRTEVERGSIKTAAVVLQPACDLVRPDVLKARKATILMCHGDVTPLTPSTPMETMDTLDPVILRYPARSELRHVLKWDKKRAFHWSYQELDGLKNSNQHDWVHVGRLRPLYALQLQRAITADASRVGTQRRPYPYIPHGVQLLVPKKGKWQMVLDYGFDASAGAISDDKGDHKKTFILKDVLIRETFEKMEDWLAGNGAQPAAPTIQKILQCPEAIRALMYRPADTSPEVKEKIVYPLAEVALPPEHQEALKHAIVLAVQRNEDSHFASGRDLREGETAVMVFKFVKVKE